MKCKERKGDRGAKHQVLKVLSTKPETKEKLGLT